MQEEILSSNQFFRCGARSSRDAPDKSTRYSGYPEYQSNCISLTGKDSNYAYIKVISSSDQWTTVPMAIMNFDSNLNQMPGGHITLMRSAGNNMIEVYNGIGDGQLRSYPTSHFETSTFYLNGIIMGKETSMKASFKSFSGYISNRHFIETSSNLPLITTVPNP